MFATKMLGISKIHCTIDIAFDPTFVRKTFDWKSQLNCGYSIFLNAHSPKFLKGYRDTIIKCSC